jgi:hypothetical protein
LFSQALINKGNTAWRNKFLRFLGEALLGQQKELIEALTAENTALRSIVLDQEDPRPWEDDDLRW